MFKNILLHFLEITKIYWREQEVIINWINDKGDLVIEKVETYKDIFVNSDGKLITSNRPLLLMFGRGESLWLVQNDDFDVYATGDTLREAFQDFDDLLIHTFYYYKNKVCTSASFKRAIELKELYSSTFSEGEKMKILVDKKEIEQIINYLTTLDTSSLGKAKAILALQNIIKSYSHRTNSEGIAIDEQYVETLMCIK